MDRSERDPILKRERKSIIGANIQETSVYKRRWYMVFIFTTVNALQNYVLTRWGPIQTSTKLVYGWNDGIVAFQLNLSCISFAISMIPFLWILETKGLRYGFVSCSFLIALGTSVKCIGTNDNLLATILICSGSFINGLAGPVVRAAPPMLSAIWFPAKERVLSTAIAIIGSLFGAALPFVFGPTLVPDIDSLCQTEAEKNFTNCTTREEQRQKIMVYNYIEAGIAVALFIMVLIYYPAKPPKPPSMTAQIERVHILSGLKQCFFNKNLWLIAFAYSMVCGNMGDWVALVTVIYSPLGVNQEDAGWIGFLSQIVGGFTCVLFSRIANKFHQHMKRMLIILTACCLMFMVLILLLVEVKELHIYPETHNIVIYYIATIGLLAFGNATQSLYLEISCEAEYPLPESVIGGMLTFINNLHGVLFLSLMFGENAVHWINYVIAGAILLTLPLILKFKATYSRFHIDTSGGRLGIESSIQKSTSISMKESSEKNYNI